MCIMWLNFPAFLVDNVDKSVDNPTYLVAFPLNFHILFFFLKIELLFMWIT